MGLLGRMITSSGQDDIICHAYSSAIPKLEKAARYGSSAACAYLAK